MKLVLLFSFSIICLCLVAYWPSPRITRGNLATSASLNKFRLQKIERLQKSVEIPQIQKKDFQQLNTAYKQLKKLRENEPKEKKVELF